LSYALVLGMGFGVGILLGLTGIGSGSVLTPLLILFGGLAPASAVGTSLTFAFVTKIFGSWRFYRRRLVDIRAMGRLLLGSVPGLLVGIGLVLHLRGVSTRLENLILTRAIGMALAAVSILMVARFLPSTEEHPLVLSLTRFCKRHEGFLLLLTGFVVSVAVTLTSIGAGAALLPALYLIYKKDSGTLVGTSIVFGTILSAVGGLLHAGTGDVDLRIAGMLVAGSIPGIWLSSHVHARLPRQITEGAIAVTLLVLGLRFLLK
jgi:uncharacterized protein